MRSAVFAMLLGAWLVPAARAQLWSVPFPKADERGHHAESLAFAPNGQYVVSAGYHVSLRGEGGSAELCFRDVKAGTELKSFRGKPGGYALRAGSMAISPDGKTIAAAGSYAPGVGETVRCWIDLWDIDTRKVRVTLAADEGVVSWVNFSPDGKKLIASSQGSGVVVLWDVATGKELRRLQPSKGIWPAIFVLEGKVIAVGHGDGVISFWSPESGKKLGEVTSRPWSWPMSLASHGNLLASGGVDSGKRGAPPVQLWELAWDKRDDSRITATEKKTFLGHDPGAVYSVAFTRNAEYLVSGGQ